MKRNDIYVALNDTMYDPTTNSYGIKRDELLIIQDITASYDYATDRASILVDLVSLDTNQRFNWQADHHSFADDLMPIGTYYKYMDQFVWSHLTSHLLNK